MSNRQIVRLYLLVFGMLLGILVTTADLAAQTSLGTSSVGGEVRDASGSVIEDAKVELADLERLVDRGHEPSGYIDCWVNNAGSARPQDVGPLLDLTEGQWDAVTDLNLKWTFFACQAKPVEFVFHDVEITAGKDVAFATAICRCADLSSGEKVQLEFRLTMGLRKLNGRWRIMHEHHSIPATA